MSGKYSKSMRKKTAHSLKRSFEKELSYIECVISEPITVEYLGKRVELFPPRTIKISSSIYERKYSCLDYKGCDLCCAGCWSLFLSKVTPRTITKKIQTKLEIAINGREVVYYASDHQNPQSDCQFLTKEGCTVHKNNPITCMFPLIKFQKRKSGIVYIMKSIYSRNWILKCPVKFSPYSDFEEFKKDTMQKFYRFKKYMDSLKIKNKMDDVIYCLEHGVVGEVKTPIAHL